MGMGRDGTTQNPAQNPTQDAVRTIARINNRIAELEITGEENHRFRSKAITDYLQSPQPYTQEKQAEFLQVINLCANKANELRTSLPTIANQLDGLWERCGSLLLFNPLITNHIENSRLHFTNLSETLAANEAFYNQLLILWDIKKKLESLQQYFTDITEDLIMDYEEKNITKISIALRMIETIEMNIVTFNKEKNILAHNITQLNNSVTDASLQNYVTSLTDQFYALREQNYLKHNGANAKNIIRIKLENLIINDNNNSNSHLRNLYLARQNLRPVTDEEESDTELPLSFSEVIILFENLHLAISKLSEMQISIIAQCNNSNALVRLKEFIDESFKADWDGVDDTLDRLEAYIGEIAGNTDTLAVPMDLLDTTVLPEDPILSISETEPNLKNPRKRELEAAEEESVLFKKPKITAEIDPKISLQNLIIQQKSVIATLLEYMNDAKEIFHAIHDDQKTAISVLKEKIAELTEAYDEPELSAKTEQSLQSAFQKLIGALLENLPQSSPIFEL